jgi:hypothetical protein
VHHYLLVGRGPVEFIKHIPNYKDPVNLNPMNY